ncbi:MAG: acetyltransferase [Ideonella sp. MAG2]|nr:MAG: acetyltransferase [Ideonella sp. MAG2]
MAERLYLVGCGGHGRVVLDAALACGLAVTGIIDPGLAPGSLVFGVLVLGGDDYLYQAEARACLLNGVGANPNVARRRGLYDSLSVSHAFVGVRHPGALINRPGEIDLSAQVMAGAIMQPGVVIGPNAVINTGASIDHDCVLQAHVFVSPRAVLCGQVQVDEGAFIGAGAILMPGVRVGAG